MAPEQIHAHVLQINYHRDVVLQVRYRNYILYYAVGLVRLCMFDSEYIIWKIELVKYQYVVCLAKPGTKIHLAHLCFSF